LCFETTIKEVIKIEELKLKW